MSQCGESTHQPIIPGLPDELGIRCLAMLSHGYHGVMEAVSKRWRDMMRSEEYASLKAREGWCGDWLFVHTERSRYQWIAYDPEADRWHPLPPTPRSLYKMVFFRCHCACNKLLVIGETIQMCGSRISVLNAMFQFDPFKKEWNTVTSMRTPRVTFASCAMDGKIYVAGGCSFSDHGEEATLTEVYDPLTHRWEDLPPMPVPMKFCTGIAYKGKLHVRSGDGEGICQTEIFDPLSRSWHEKYENWGPRQVKPAVADDQFYAISGSRGTRRRVERRDAEKDEWHIVGEAPPLPVFDADGYELYGYKLAVLGHELYVMWGRYDTIEDSEGDHHMGEDLDRVWVCDPRCLPLTWRETRPMRLGASGSIQGWASLKQQ